MRMLTVMLIVLFGWLQYHLWWGKNGMEEYLDVSAVTELTAQANDKLNQRNQQMFAEIADLKRGQEAIEERARNELGMIKPGETFFRIVSD
ncbi:cell division protein FtsB [Enterovibrio norvegicus FF-33]|uniref:Cell division protein FtsB n=1 Tax=Enterovibrio norvegicus FF-454 TaxID=1185651 RepID=A0A1E5C843_9GAMM|nr:cell division protein FtsB [Enterovibrio norvegicus]OEE61683.1 cell division protein FtsB [Enterovibrio norvegicus FF-454]OEE66478.1 cell division protein FtsB [Enterovibrio norvegicus FF-33]OEE88346.1 cell division protein FtsB [Enterovibrio norvegicus FF-162]